MLIKRKKSVLCSIIHRLKVVEKLEIFEFMSHFLHPLTGFQNNTFNHQPEDAITFFPNQYTIETKDFTTTRKDSLSSHRNKIENTSTHIIPKVGTHIIHVNN